MIRVVLIDDHAVFRESLSGWFESNTTDIRVVSSTGNQRNAVDLIRQQDPDVALFDIVLGEIASFEVARAVRAASPRTRLIFLSAFTTDRYIEEAISLGAAGFLSKNEPAQFIAQSVRDVSSGGSAFSRAVTDRLVFDNGGVRLSQNCQTRISILTPREREILRHLVIGLSKKEIATVVGVSVGTVNNHAAHIMKKLDIHDRVELARFAIREGLVQA